MFNEFCILLCLYLYFHQAVSNAGVANHGENVNHFVIVKSKCICHNPRNKWIRARIDICFNLYLRLSRAMYLLSGLKR